MPRGKDMWLTNSKLFLWEKWEKSALKNSLFPNTLSSLQVMGLSSNGAFLESNLKMTLKSPKNNLFKL